MVELVRQRRQRPAPGPADHDLPHQVTGQRLGQHPARHPQQLHRRLPGTGDVRVIQDSQPGGDPRLQRLQQRRLPSQRHLRRAAEHLTDHHHQLLSLLARWGQLRGGGLNGGLNGRPQRPLLISAQHPCDQLLTAGIGDQPDQPRQQIIDDKDHVSSLPPSVVCRADVMQVNMRWLVYPQPRADQPFGRGNDSHCGDRACRS